PSAEFIQILVADHFARDIPGGHSPLLTLIAPRAPVIPFVWRKGGLNVISGRFRTHDGCRLLRMHRKGRAHGGHLRLSKPIGHSRVALPVDVDAIQTWTKQGYSGIRCVDFEYVGDSQLPETYI